MNYQDYAPLAIRTAKFTGNKNTDIFHARIGLVTEVGEICDAFKKSIIYGRSLDRVNLTEELGDAFWYLNLLVHVEKSAPLQANEWLGEPVEMVGRELESVLMLLAQQAGMVAAGTVSPRYLQRSLEALAFSFGIKLEDCLRINIEKLAARYGDKYTDFAALNRDLGVERTILEG